jgi:hypothetical protein
MGGMARFSSKDFLVATTLCAAGVGAYYLDAVSEKQLPVLSLALWFAIGPLIGAGIFAPFKRPWISSIVGFVVQFLVFLCLMRTLTY